MRISFKLLNYLFRLATKWIINLTISAGKKEQINPKTSGINKYNIELYDLGESPEKPRKRKAKGTNNAEEKIPTIKLSKKLLSEYFSPFIGKKGICAINPIK